MTKLGRLQGVTEAGRGFLQRSGEYCRMERAIMARTLAGKPPTKSALMAEFGFPGRMVHTALIHAKGMIDSARECASLHLADATEAIGRKLAEYWEASEAPNGRSELRGRRRGLDRLVAREARAEANIERPSIFPGRRAFLHQTKHWKADYEATRSDHIGCVGSSDEARGNSTLQVTLAETELLKGKLWQWCHLSHAGEQVGRFRLRAGENAELVDVLRANTAPKRLAEVDAWLDATGKLLHPKTVMRMQKDGLAPVATRKLMRAITAGRTPLHVMLHRHDDGRWYVHVSYSQSGLPESFVPVGWMGVDLNADSLAHAVVAKDLALLSYGKTYFPQGGPRGERATALFRQVNALVAEAKARQLGLSLEFLEFEGSKRWLQNKLGQILRVFPYRKIRAMFEDRCRAAGVPLRFVPPGYSSILGALMAQRWPELGRDQAASVVLAARAFAEGNRWLEEQCRAAVQAERITLRFNAKGLFGHNTTVIRPAHHRAEDGHQWEHPRQPRTLSPLRWQLCCGKRISAVLVTLRSDFRAKVLAARRAAVAQGRSKPVLRPMVPALFKFEQREVSPRLAQLCSGSN